MTITLAPMEGVVDVHMREMLTQIGGFDQCVTEFVRVSQGMAHKEWFYKFCPELDHGSLTPSGVPVHIQIMGSEPNVVAMNASMAARELGALAIDLNFGCPAKTVNRHCAGAALLQWPEKLYEICKTTHRALNGVVPLSAKMRLGFKDKSLAVENAKAFEEAGVSKLTVHARTKLEGYKPPAHWEWINRIREAVDIPVVANGEIWTPEDAKRCRDVSGCHDIMIGRGAIARPSLAREIKGGDFAEWPEMLGWLDIYARKLRGEEYGHFAEGRIKQWVKLLSRTYPEAKDLFERIKRMRDVDHIYAEIMQGHKPGQHVA